MHNAPFSEYLVPQSIIVNIGSIPVGGNYPVRIQSMTNTNTMDTDATVRQCIELIEAGCDYVRISTPGIRETENLATIKKKLKQKNYNTPLIADVHYRPAVAETAARLVEKIRINPGNYTDKNFKIINPFSETEYADHLAKMRQKLSSLVAICKEYGTVIRIGVNHGSLSERIVKRYGNTVEGMVESAMEFIKVCESLNFKNLVVSMKSSNVITMVQATRLLISRMMREGCIYPVHLGVTEAGNNEDAISKSAAGCGALLNDGIGDTIRVSLTGNPVNEVPVAKTIAEFFNNIRYLKPANLINNYKYEYLTNFSKSKDNELIEKKCEFTYPVILSWNNDNIDISDILSNSGFIYNEKQHNWIKTENIPDIINIQINKSVNPTFGDNNIFNNLVYIKNNKKYLNLPDNKNKQTTIEKYLLAQIITIDINKPVLRNDVKNSLLEESKLNFAEIEELKPNNDFLIKISMTLGVLLINEMIQGIILNVKTNDSKTELIKAIYTLLQATHKRISFTEYVSCPTCSRTTYDVEGTLQKIKEKIQNNANLKIAVMGCMVNGPGEMADADYGYIGVSPGRVNIYRKNNIIFKNIPENEAIDILEKLINNT